MEEFNNNACARFCCAPNHSLFTKFFVLNPDGSINTSMPPVMTMEREGVCGPNCKNPCCFACMACCRDSMRVHAGDITEGEPGNVPMDRVMGGCEQPFLGGGFTPTVQVMDREQNGLSETPLSVVEGPFCCIGGCLQMCLDMSFSFSNIPEGYKGEVVKLGDLATIEKKKPHDFSSAMREAMTDADTYTVTFVDPGLTPQQKACIIATVIQLDYMVRDRRSCNARVVSHCIRNRLLTSPLLLLAAVRVRLDPCTQCTTVLRKRQRHVRKLSKSIRLCPHTRPSCPAVADISSMDSL